MFDPPSTSRVNSKKKANLMSLSREYSDSEKSMRSQYTVSSMEVDGEKHPCEKVWKNNGYFGELKTDFVLHKKDFPENALLYLNQAYISSKDGDPVIYCDYVVLGQLLILKNPGNEPNCSSYVNLYSPSYDREQGKFLVVKETLAYIMIRGYEDETFYTPSRSFFLLAFFFLSHQASNILPLAPPLIDLLLLRPPFFFFDV